MHLPPEEAWEHPDLATARTCTGTNDSILLEVKWSGVKPYLGCSASFLLVEVCDLLRPDSSAPDLAGAGVHLKQLQLSENGPSGDRRRL